MKNIKREEQHNIDKRTAKRKWRNMQKEVQNKAN